MTDGLDPKRMKSASWSPSSDDSLEDDNASEFKQDAGSVPTETGINNKFDYSMAIGDSQPIQFADVDNASDFTHDSQGVPMIDQGEKYDYDYGSPTNRFPRETGSDTADDLTLT